MRKVGGSGWIGVWLYWGVARNVSVVVAGLRDSECVMERWVSWNGGATDDGGDGAVVSTGKFGG